MRRIHRLPVALAVLSILILCSTAFADERTLHLNFEAKHQSMWGPMNAPPPVSLTLPIIKPSDVSWSQATSGYPALKPGFTTVDTYFWGDVSFGLGARASTDGHFGLFTTMSVPNSGSVDVTYPANVRLTFPDANSFRAGDTVAIGSSYTLGETWELKTTSPVIEFSLDTDLRIRGDLYAKACVVACVDTTQILGLPTMPSFDLNYPNQNLLKIKTGDVFQTPAILSLLIPVSVTAGIPEINCAKSGGVNCSSASEVRSLTASGSEQFLYARLNLVNIAKTLAGGPAWLVLNLDTRPFGGSGVYLHYTTFSAFYGAGLSTNQKFRFDPNLSIRMQFPETIEYWLASNATHQTGTLAEMPVGDTIYVKTNPANKNPVPVTPTFTLAKNTFHSETGFSVNQDVDLAALDFGVKIPPVEIVPRLCTPGFCVDLGFLGEACVPEICTPAITFDFPDFEAGGPLWSYAWDRTDFLGNLYSNSWNLGGFPTFTESDVPLDPENPIIKIQQVTGAAKNLGYGRRLVPFTVDIWNGGDVPLSYVKAQSALQAAFSTARGYNVERLLTCGLTLNSGFNGGSDTELLGDGNVLAVGASKRVIIWAVVRPQPDPAPYVVASATQGRSPLDTPVSASTTSSILLGPGTPGGAADFVLFGEHFVKLEAIRDSIGHIGSNDFIEVKNGKSANVAGDLRGGKSVKVQGEISADYILSGGVVDIVGKGKLTLYGNMKMYQSLPTFTSTSPAFAPTTAMMADVWVNKGTALAIDPGYYDYITVNGGGVLTLAPGRYFVRNFDVLAGARVNATGAVSMVTSDLQIGGGAVIAASGSTRELRIEAVQTGAIEIGPGASIRATLNAPRANVVFGAQSRIEGSAYGKSITMMAGSAAEYHHDCDRSIDANCDGSPDCP